MTAPEDRQDGNQQDFLSRWSQRKQQARQEESSPPAKPQSAEQAPPVLPSVESLNKDSDFTGFMHAKVDEKLRRAALKKLFTDPHFNVMDGLDVYVDDYSITEPIPAEMMAQLRHAQAILMASADRRREAAEAEAAEAAKREASTAVPAQELEAVPLGQNDNTQTGLQQTMEAVPDQAAADNNKTTG